MTFSKFSSPSPRLFCFLVVTLIAFSVAASAAINGALQTTDPTGTVVNYNTGLPCDQVYITGGPQNTNDAGLVPVGPTVTYYFQVTDPAGKVILYTDAVSNRTLTSGTNSSGKGVITGTTGTHLTGGNGPSGETTVQLFPFTQTPNNGGVYKAWISTDPLFQNSTTKTDNFKCTFVPPPDCSDPVFAEEHPDECGTPPPPTADILGEKFYDSNANGQLDSGELGIQGWQIRSQEATLSGQCTLTDQSGLYAFSVTPDSGDYHISEDDALQAAWLHTTATSGTATAGEGTIQGPNFGNLCVGKGNGLTLGYWSNKNGQAAMGCSGAGSQKCTTELTFLCTLNLVDGNGNKPKFCSSLKYSDFASWLLSANATNMAYMLSAQLAAMELNTRDANPLVSGGALVYLGPPPSLSSGTCFDLAGETSPNSGNFISISDLMNDAKIELGTYPLTIGSGDTRSCEQYKKNGLDSANNNLNFVQSDQSKCPAFTFANTCQ